MLMIQIISNNEIYEKFDKSIYCISKISEFQAFDNFKLNIIDLNYVEIWKNKKNDTLGVNDALDLISLKKAIIETDNSEVIIIFPQNLEYKYNWGYDGRNILTYTKSQKIKNITSNFCGIICNSLINMDNIEFIFGKSDIEIDGIKYNADFYFSNVAEENVIQKASNKKSNI